MCINNTNNNGILNNNNNNGILQDLILLLKIPVGMQKISLNFIDNLGTCPQKGSLALV
jgi:hypothetical protein